MVIDPVSSGERRQIRQCGVVEFTYRPLLSVGKQRPGGRDPRARRRRRIGSYGLKDQARVSTVAASIPAAWSAASALAEASARLGRPRCGFLFSMSGSIFF